MIFLSVELLALILDLPSPKGTASSSVTFVRSWLVNPNLRKVHASLHMQLFCPCHLLDFCDTKHRTLLASCSVA